MILADTLQHVMLGLLIIVAKESVLRNFRNSRSRMRNSMIDSLERRVAELEARVARLKMPNEARRKDSAAHKRSSAWQYLVPAALIAIAAIAAMQGLGNQLKSTFTNVSETERH